jgi:hypothetical protein
VTVHVIGYMLRFASELRGGQSRCLSESTGGMFLSTETTEELSEALRKTLACPLISSRERYGYARALSSATETAGAAREAISAASGAQSMSSAKSP